MYAWWLNCLSVREVPLLYQYVRFLLVLESGTGTKYQVPTIKYYVLTRCSYFNQQTYSRETDGQTKSYACPCVCVLTGTHQVLKCSTRNLSGNMRQKTAGEWWCAQLLSPSYLHLVPHSTQDSTHSRTISKAGHPRQRGGAY